MKKDTAIIKKLLVVAIILAVVTISIVAFIGVFTKNLNKMSNVIPDYTYGTEFEGNREYKFKLDETEEDKEVYVDQDGNICGEVVEDDSDSTETEITTDEESSEEVESSTETEEEDNTEIEGYTKETRTIKANDESVLTKDSYKKSKKIIEDRLQKLGASQYNVRLDEISGDMIVELPDDDDADFLYEAISSKGDFKIIDSETGLELMNNKHIKSASAGYSSSSGSYTVYLQIQFNKEGTQILKDISNEYIEKEVEETEENAEETETVDESTENDATETDTDTDSDTDTEEAETEIKYIEIQVDETTIMKTYFAEEMDGGYIQIPMGQYLTDTSEVQNYLKSANAIAVLLNTGNLPNKYSLENDNFMQSTISVSTINNLKIALYVIILIMAIILVIKFGLNGLLAAILNTGYVAVVSLALRYTNVIITISSLVTLFGIMLINFGFMYILLKYIKNGILAKKAYKDAMKTLYLSIIPVCIVAFVFTFIQNASVTGIGMILFWGIIVQALYSLIFTRSIYVLKEK